MNDDNNLDLLDLDDNASMDTLPDAVPFGAPRPKKPWLLLTVGLAVIVLATYIIIRAIGDDDSSSMEVDLDVPVMVDNGAGQAVPVDMNVMPPVQPVQVAPQPKPMPQPQPQQKPQSKPAPQPAPVAQVQPVQPVAGIPVRVVEERKDVTFNPEAVAKPAVKPRAVKPAPKPVAKPVPKPKAQPKPQPQAAAGSWYVQFGSYSSRAMAESAQRQMQNAHQGLFAGKQFVILAAQLKDGKTTYRLRVAFKTAAEANGFCRNAKSDGLDCYVAK